MVDNTTRLVELNFHSRVLCRASIIRIFHAQNMHKTIGRFAQPNIRSKKQNFLGHPIEGGYLDPSNTL